MRGDGGVFGVDETDTGAGVAGPCDVFIVQ
jgi:hypothetical protein